jgi:hypothetical protein
VSFEIDLDKLGPDSKNLNITYGEDIKSLLTSGRLFYEIKLYNANGSDIFALNYQGAIDYLEKVPAVSSSNLFIIIFYIFIFVIVAISVLLVYRKFNKRMATSKVINTSKEFPLKMN